MKIGIDFGSTYSAVSAYFPGTDNVKALKIGGTDSGTIPTVVSISRTGKVSFGSAAKSKIGNQFDRTFEAFKMLLIETDPQVLTARGYDDTYTPRRVAKLFLESVLRPLLENNRSTKDEIFENVVFCVPEVWCNSVRTQDGRSILRDIIQKEVDVPVGSVRVVTEPEAASAYFAYHYEQETKKTFNGHLLLIDFGGGTLDLTLTEVKSYGQGNMEISFRAGGGAGENHDGSIGAAGIAFMQRVIALALKKAGIVDRISDIDYTDKDFLTTVNQLEVQLIGSQMDIEDFYGGLAASYSEIKRIPDGEDEEFLCLAYKRDPLPITFLDLYRAYTQVVEATVSEQVGLINRQVKELLGFDPCTVSAGERDDFKIAQVGGFTSFCLVKMQLAEIYHLDPNDKVDLRVRNIDVENKELAISLGAALLAAGRVRQQRISRFSIGLSTAPVDGKRQARYAIHRLQELQPETPYYILRNPDEKDEPKNRIKYGALYKNVTDFAINYTNDPTEAVRLRLKPEMIQRLQERLPREGLLNCGFSVDRNDTLYFHALPTTFSNKCDYKKEEKIPLESFDNLFEPTEL